MQVQFLKATNYEDNLLDSIFFSWTQWQYIKVVFCNPNQVQSLHQFSENHQNLLTHWKSFWWKITLIEQTETAPPGDISPRQWPLFKQMSYRGTKLVGVLRPGGQLKKNHTDLCGNSTRGGRIFFFMQAVQYRVLGPLQWQIVGCDESRGIITWQSE